MLSALSGLFLLVINDPPRGSSEPELSDVITEETAQQYAFKLSDLPTIARIRSWWWVASNQMIDNIPMMVTYGWAFTWLNSLNMGDEAFIFIGLLTLGMMSGHVLFGSLGDVVEKRHPNRGRTTMGLIGSILTIPTLTAMFAFGDRGLGFLMAFGLMAGLSLSSVDTGARWPISQGILYPEIRGTGCYRYAQEKGQICCCRSGL